MAERVRWSMERRGDPAGQDGALGYVVALAVVLGILIAATFLSGADHDRRPPLWIYTADWCGPCQKLHSGVDQKRALTQFRVMWLQVPAGVQIPIPRIAWWGPDGKPCYFDGWAAGSEAQFLSYWKQHRPRGF